MTIAEASSPVIAETASPVILVCAAQGHPLVRQLRERGAQVVVATSGLASVARSIGQRPDVVVVDGAASGTAALAVCHALRTDPLVGATVPLLILLRDRPTPEVRVASLRAGVWEFVRYAGASDGEEVWLKLEGYARAKRNIEQAIADGLADPMTGLLNAPGLVRRGRELVALLARERAAVACLVFAVPAPLGTAVPGAVAAGTSRVSDVVGVLDARRFAVFAPATGSAGAVRLAERVGDVLRSTAGLEGEAAALRVGYHAVDNVGYQPMDAVELLRRATAALEGGTPDESHPWVRRFESATP